jgi:hypothetical protein
MSTSSAPSTASRPTRIAYIHQYFTTRDIPGGTRSFEFATPFIFEVRDLWPEMPIEIGALRNPVARRLAVWLARTAFRSSSHVVASSPGMAGGVQAAAAAQRLAGEQFSRDDHFARFEHALLGDVNREPAHSSVAGTR